MIFDPRFYIGIDDVSVRPETPQDQDFARMLYTDTRAPEFAGTGLPQHAIAQLLDGQFRSQTAFYRTQHPHAKFAILQQGATNIGRFYLDDSATPVHILEMEILPAWQGRGIGTQLLTSVRNTTHAAGRSLSLHVAKQNPAQNLYARLGFTVAGDTETHWFMVCGL